MIVLYKANETNFGTLGLGVLTDIVRSRIPEERNGQFYMEFQYPVDGICFKELKVDRIIKAEANPKSPDQRFKIIRITKPAKGFVTVHAEHVSNHTADLQLKPEVSYSGNADTALNVWRQNIVTDHPFTTYSDITTTGEGEWTIDEVEHARQALGGVQGSILDTYKGEYRFDNYHIMLLKDRGNDNGIPIMYGKNLTDLEQDEEIASTYTSVMPYATFTPEGADDSVTITLPEYFVDSEHVDKYARRKILRVDFTSDEIETVSALRTRAKRYIKENDVGVPKVNLRVQFVDLAKTLDYKDTALSEEINLCDWVTVYFEKLGIKQRAKVIKVVYDPSLKTYVEIEVGETRASLSDSINSTVDGKLEGVQNQIDRVQTAANGKNKVFRSGVEPLLGMSLNDLWYKPVGDGEMEMYTYTGTYWKLEKVSAGLLQGTLDADVENGDVDIINMNANNITANRGNFINLALQDASSFTSINAQGLRATHTDGSYTQLTNQGLQRYTAGDNRNYHYLIYATTFVYGTSSSNSTRWIQLPNDFKGKDFRVYLSVADSMDAIDYTRSIQRIVATQHPNYSIDYRNAQVPIIAYKSETKGDGVAPRITDIQGMLLAIY